MNKSKDFDKIICLISTQEQKNIDLAIQLCRGNNALKNEVFEYYKEFIALFGYKSLSALSKIYIDAHASSAKLMKSSQQSLNQYTVQLLNDFPILQLNWSKKKIKTLPTAICHLKRLEKLDLNSNELTTLPEEIENLENLKSLNLNRNPLLNLPNNIGELKALETLQIAYNQLVTLPESFCHLENLSWLNMEGQSVMKLPKHFDKLKKISYFNLKGSYLEMKYPNKSALPINEYIRWILNQQGQ